MDSAFSGIETKESDVLHLCSVPGGADLTELLGGEYSPVPSPHLPSAPLDVGPLNPARVWGAL